MVKADSCLVFLKHYEPSLCKGKGNNELECGNAFFTSALCRKKMLSLCEVWTPSGCKGCHGW